MALLGAVAWLSLRIGDGRDESACSALVAGVSAAPGLLFVGAPFADDSQYPMAILASIPMWLLLGLFASRRATRSTVASWRDYWREMTFLTLAVVLGAIVALAVGDVRSSTSLFSSGSSPTSDSRSCQTVTGRGGRSSLAGPMPGTRSRSSTDANGPLRVRSSMIAAAVAGPTPGNVSRSAAVAVLRSIGPRRGRPAAGGVDRSGRSRA